MHILKAPKLQGARYEHHACAVERRVDNLQVLLALDDIRVDRQALDFLKIHLVYFLTNNFDEFFLALELHVFHLHLVHLVDNARVVRSQHLGTVFPISLVAVVFTRVVRSCDVHTALTAQMANGERALRCGAHVVKKIHLDVIGGEYVGHRLSKKTAVVAAVVANHHRDLLAVGKVFLEIVGKALGGQAYGVNIHSVGTRTHNATESTSTKFQILVETLNKIGLIVGLYHFFHSFLRFSVKGWSKPLLRFFHTLGNELLIVFHNS